MKKILALVAIVTLVACNSAETKTPVVDTTMAPAMDTAMKTVDTMMKPAADTTMKPATK